MIMNHQIYMEEIVLDTIKDELGEDKIIWYKEEQTRLVGNTYKETDYFLTDNYIIQAKIMADKLFLKKYNRSAIKRVEKEFDIKGNNVILKNVEIYFANDKDEERLFLGRPNESNNGEPKEFEKFAKNL